VYSADIELRMLAYTLSLSEIVLLRLQGLSEDKFRKILDQREKFELHSDNTKEILKRAAGNYKNRCSNH